MHWIQICRLDYLDRERKDELPQMQVSFIDLICLPLYKMLSDSFPWIKPLYNGTLDNRNHWQDLAEKVEMGYGRHFAALLPVAHLKRFSFHFFRSQPDVD